MNSVSTCLPIREAEQDDHDQRDPAISFSPTILDRLSSCFCSGVLMARVCDSRSAMWPISVLHPRGRHDHLTSTAGDRGVHVRHPGADRRGHIGATAPARSLADREALAGERALLDLERRRDGDPTVGRDPVSRLDQDDVPGTSSSASISSACPSRRTRAIVFIIWASAVTLSSAFVLPEIRSTACEDGQPGQDDGGGGVTGDEMRS